MFGERVCEAVKLLGSPSESLAVAQELAHCTEPRYGRLPLKGKSSPRSRLISHSRRLHVDVCSPAQRCRCFNSGRHDGHFLCDYSTVLRKGSLVCFRQDERSRAARDRRRTRIGTEAPGLNGGRYLAIYGCTA